IKVKFLTKYKDNTAIYNNISLKETLYIPSFPLNITSSYKLYLSGGTLIKEKAYTSSRKLLNLLNFQKNGFFFIPKNASKAIINY
ncbi:hypothetical protein QBC43DRAFT_223854, partial [Cladorrhinum sp. PSN259]